MYTLFYHLIQNPFNITADPEFFYSSRRHAEAFSHLTYGIQHRKGILVVTGEIGTGKTTLCRMLLNRLDRNVRTAFILNPNFSNLQLIQMILRDLGLKAKAKNKFEMVEVLNQFLLEQSSRQQNVVVILDESQNLGVKQLEQIRLLSNLETEKQKLLQIILVGQPELLDKLKLDSLRQLNQRIAVRYHMLPLDPNEVKEYINHRLQIAFDPLYSGPKVTFTDKAIDRIYESSKGTPRMINIICERALLAGYVAETMTIDEHIIHKSVEEVVYL